MQRLKFVFAGLLLTSPAIALAQDEPGGDPAVPAEGEAALPPATGETTPPATETAVAAKKMTVGADAAFVLPLGDYADGADAAVGVLGRFEFAVTPMISVTGRIGYLYHIGTPDGVSLSMIPVLVGGTYKIGTSGVFLHAEVGVTNIRASFESMGFSGSDSETKLSIQAGVGYQMGKINARAGLYVPGSDDDDGAGGSGDSTTLYGILGSVGFDFASF